MKTKPRTTKGTKPCTARSAGNGETLAARPVVAVRAYWSGGCERSRPASTAGRTHTREGLVRDQAAREMRVRLAPAPLTSSIRTPSALVGNRGKSERPAEHNQLPTAVSGPAITSVWNGGGRLARPATACARGGQRSGGLCKDPENTVADRWRNSTPLHCTTGSSLAAINLLRLPTIPSRRGNYVAEDLRMDQVIPRRGWRLFWTASGRRAAASKCSRWSAQPRRRRQRAEHCLRPRVGAAVFSSTGIGRLRPSERRRATNTVYATWLGHTGHGARNLCVLWETPRRRAAALFNPPADVPPPRSQDTASGGTTPRRGAENPTRDSYYSRTLRTRRGFSTEIAVNMNPKKYRRSKHTFKTRVVRTGTKGTLALGEIAAKRDIERQLQRPLAETAKKCHTRHEWCWREPK